MERVRTLTFSRGNSNEEEPKALNLALDKIYDIIDPLLSGVEYEDELRDSLREVLFAVKNSDDSAEKKLGHIKYIAEQALK